MMAAGAGRGWDTKWGALMRNNGWLLPIEIKDIPLDWSEFVDEDAIEVSTATEVTASVVSDAWLELTSLALDRGCLTATENEVYIDLKRLWK